MKFFDVVSAGTTPEAALGKNQQPSAQEDDLNAAIEQVFAAVS
jgi:hypothetical protein